VLAELVAGAGYRVTHLAQNMQAAFSRLIERDTHDLLRDAGDLDVHLERGDTLFGAGDLEIHVAEMVLISQDVRQDGEASSFEDEPHGYPGDWTPHWNAGIHQGERASADRCHR